MTTETPMGLVYKATTLVREVRIEVMRLGAAIGHDDDQQMEESLNRLGELLEITGEDMDAFVAHYHEPPYGPHSRPGRCEEA